VKALLQNIAIIILTFLLGCVSLASAQEQFRHYSSDEGFTGSAFKRIVQDSLGFLWITSGSGIFRFDGYNFIKYEHDTKNITAAGVDPTGGVWVTTEERLMSYDYKRSSFDTINLPSSEIIANSIGFSGNSKVWIGTRGKGLYYLARTNRSFTAVPNVPDPEANTIFDIVNEQGTLLLGTSHGIWRYDPELNKYSRPFLEEKIFTLSYSGAVKKIFAHRGYYWIWVNQQLIKVRANGTIVNTLDFEKIRNQFDPENKFSQAEITSIAEDKDEKFWITTSGIGLIYYDPLKNECRNFRHDQLNESSLPGDLLFHVMIDRDENVWFSTVNKGIVLKKKKSINFHNYLKGFSSTAISVLPRNGSPQIVAGTNGGGLWTALYSHDSIANMNFSPFKIDSASGFENILEMGSGKSTLWIGSYNAGVIGLPVSPEGQLSHTPEFRFQNDPTNPRSLSQNFITSIWEGTDGYIWIGTFGAGLNVGRKSSGSGDFSIYRPDPDNPHALGGSGVRMVLRQNDGSVILAQFSGIDQVLNPGAHDALKFNHLLKDVYCSQVINTVSGTLVAATINGLYEGFKEGNSYRFESIALVRHPNITSLQEDQLGRIWCMTFEGLFCYDPKTKFVLRFMKEDGLVSSRTVSAGRSTQTEDGVMIFSNAEGLVVFDPLTLHIDDTKPRPLLTQLKVNNETVSSQKNEDGKYTIAESIFTLDELELDHTHHILELEFSAMDMTAPEKIRYKYMLENFNDSWVEADWRSRRATYTNLEPGNYTFKVMAANRDGVWSNHVASISIVVLPAPWDTWWAYTIYASIFAGLLYMARRSLLKEERLKASLQIEEVELEKKQMELLKAQEVDKLKSSFFTNISHEFRTPLTLIQGPVQLLLEKFSDDPKIKRQLQLIQNNVLLLLKLINQLLELSRLESGNLTIENVPTELNGFMHSMVTYFESQVRQKNLAVHLDLPEHSYSVNVDKGKLETILINLIGNAMKFTSEHGRVSVGAAIERNANIDSATLSLLVADNGIGIPEDKQTLIFDRFYQVSETHNQIGTGIGLALVKELTDLLGGTIQVKSKPGVGSEFTVRLPVQIIASLPVHQPEWSDLKLENGIADGSNGSAGKAANIPKILVVEDNQDLRQFIIESFDGAYQFLEAATGVEGHDKAIHEIPELIISDIMMPEMDGITMSAKIKKDIRACHIPILFLTAKATEKSKLSGLGTGAEDYLTKPFNKTELILKVRNIIMARDKIREKLRLELLSEAPSVVVQSSDEQFLVKVKEVIHRRLNDSQLGVDSLCVDIGMSRTQLYRKINALTGYSVNELIRKFRLKRAAQLLDQHWGGVSDIAYEIGFTNLSYFSKCFKDEFGVSPSEYTHSKGSDIRL
jgi:signal transduction histidine kinase/DNA-binding response OmpR family regulator/ligand-binding sensor domain-containing protein